MKSLQQYFTWFGILVLGIGIGYLIFKLSGCKKPFPVNNITLIRDSADHNVIDYKAKVDSFKKQDSIKETRIFSLNTQLTVYRSNQEKLKAELSTKEGFTISNMSAYVVNTDSSNAFSDSVNATLTYLAEKRMEQIVYDSTIVDSLHKHIDLMASQSLSQDSALSTQLGKAKTGNTLLKIAIPAAFIAGLLIK